MAVSYTHLARLGAPETAPGKLVANLPYAVAATVVLDYFEQFPSLESATVMVQKEVADRMAAVPGTKNYGAYTVKLRLYAEPAGRFGVGPGNFFPPPRDVYKRQVYGRMEGDRFALCLPHDVALEGDYVRALEEAVAATEVDRQVVLYFGVYEIEDRTMPVDIMCDRANLALHSVKGDYNTHFALYDSDMHQTFLANHELVGEGERALREGRFEPFVQPVFDLATGALVSGEALVRWRDPQKGLVPPGQFLSLIHI